MLHNILLRIFRHILLRDQMIVVHRIQRPEKLISGDRRLHKLLQYTFHFLTVLLQRINIILA